MCISKPWAAGAEDHDVLAIVHGDLCDADVAGSFERVVQQRVGFFARLIGRHIERAFEVDRVHFVALDEFQDLHDLGGGGRHLLDVFVLDHHVAVLFVLVALDDFAARDGLIFRLAVNHLLDARVVGLVELVEADALAARGGKQLDGKRDEAEREMPLPDCSSHGDNLPIYRPIPRISNIFNNLCLIQERAGGYCSRL